MASEFSEKWVILELRVGDSVRACIYGRALDLNTVHRHDAVMGLEIGQQSQATGAGADDPIHFLGNGHHTPGHIDNSPFFRAKRGVRPKHRSHRHHQDGTQHRPEFTPSDRRQYNFPHAFFPFSCFCSNLSTIPLKFMDSVTSDSGFPARQAFWSAF